MLQVRLLWLFSWEALLCLCLALNFFLLLCYMCCSVLLCFCLGGKTEGHRATFCRCSWQIPSLPVRVFHHTVSETRKTFLRSFVSHMPTLFFSFLLSSRSECKVREENVRGPKLLHPQYASIRVPYLLSDHASLARS